MALSNYSDLQTSVASWLNKSNLSSSIPDFIALAEADINRRLRLQSMEQVGTGSTSSATIDLSSVLTRWAKIKSVTVNDASTYWILNYVSPQQFWQRHATSFQAVPEDYTLVGDTLRFGPTPDTSYTWTIWYFQKVEPLSTAGTNTILTNHPDIYLYGSLVAAEPFLKNDARLQTWKLLYESAMAAAQQESNTDRVGGTSAQTSEMGVI